MEFIGGFYMYSILGLCVILKTPNHLIKMPNRRCAEESACIRARGNDAVPQSYSRISTTRAADKICPSKAVGGGLNRRQL
jgi:hypothetical protein